MACKRRKRKKSGLLKASKFIIGTGVTLAAINVAGSFFKK